MRHTIRGQAKLEFLIFLMVQNGHGLKVADATNRLFLAIVLKAKTGY
jgi:hypothetical protein